MSRTCTCCGTDDTVTEVDSTSGLCLYCQPCPYCGRTGTGCTDENPRRCDP